MSSRRPLEERILMNVPLTPSLANATLHNDADKKRRAAADEAMEERRKRTEAESALVAAREELRMQKDTIIRLSSNPSSSDVTTLRDKLAKLVDKYEKAKHKHEEELFSARTDNKTLQSLIDTLQSSSADMQRTITSLRSDKAALSQKLRSVETAPAAPARTSEIEAKHREERLAWRREKADMEVQLKKAQREAGKAEELQRDKAVLEDERDALEETVGRMTYLYRSLYRSSAPKADLDAAREDLRLAREYGRAMKSKVSCLRREVSSTNARCLDLQDQLDAAKSRFDDLASENADLAVERSRDRGCFEIPSVAVADYHVDPLEPVDHQCFIDVLLSHLALSSSSSSALISALLSTASSLRTDLDTLKVSELEAHTSLIGASERVKTLEAQLREAEGAHASCAQHIMDWRGEAARAGATEAKLRAELSDTKRTLAGVDLQMQADQEKLKKANEQNGRNEAAMRAVEDEVTELRSALLDQHDLQHKLEAAEQNRELLQFRCHELTDELERVGQMQADLMGQSGDGQRISYMEGMRREMAIVKHELTTTRHNLNVANERIALLSDELKSYKSLDPATLASSGGRTRVSRSTIRKEPEGGEVLAASLARRAVSSSASAGWR